MIAAVVVTYSAPTELLERCINSLVAESLDTVYLVDNGENTGASVPFATEIIRCANDGYGAAVNVGVERALADGAHAVFVLNDDVVMRPGWLAPLRSACDEPHIGAAQPMLLTPGGAVNSLGVQLDRFGAGTDIGDGEPAPNLEHPAHLAVFTGGAVLLTADFLRATGGFDERFFMYYEDVDLALRGAELGWEYRLVTHSVGEHERSTSARALGDEVRFYRERNRLWAAVRFADGRTVSRAFWLSVKRLRHAPRRIHARALVAGVGGAPRRFRERRAARR